MCVAAASLERYREKKATRQCGSGKIRYQIRKTNADNRPRFKVWCAAIPVCFHILGMRNMPGWPELVGFVHSIAAINSVLLAAKRFHEATMALCLCSCC